MKYDTRHVSKATSQQIWLPAAVALLLLAWQHTVVFAQQRLSFKTSVIAEDANMWWARALGDVNGDGFLDVVLQDNNAHGGWLGWLEGPKKGAEWKRHIIASEAPGGGTFASGDLDVGDIDGDGDLDVLGFKHPGEWVKGGAPTEIYWFSNPLEASMANQRRVSTGSPDSQGVVPKRPIIGNATIKKWKPQRIGRAPACIKDVNLVDFNGDGKLDLVTITYQKNTFTVFRQDAPDKWSKVCEMKVENLHEGMDVGDIDGDGDADVATNGYWIENPGGDLTGAWTVRSIDPKWHTQDGDWSKNGTKTFCRDITGDGRVEVFISHSERSGYPVSWYGCNDPKKEKWTEHTIDKDLVAAHTLQVFDFDRDGDFDVLTGVNMNREKGLEINSWPVRIYLNQGDGKEWKSLQLTDEGIYNGQAQDVDGDGDYDIIRLPTHDGKRLEVLINQISH